VVLRVWRVREGEGGWREGGEVVGKEEEEEDKKCVTSWKCIQQWQQASKPVTSSLTPHGKNGRSPTIDQGLYTSLSDNRGAKPQWSEKSTDSG
jgi:hypothetical protein